MEAKMLTPKRCLLGLLDWRRMISCGKRRP